MKSYKAAKASRWKLQEHKSSMWSNSLLLLGKSSQPHLNTFTDFNKFNYLNTSKYLNTFNYLLLAIPIIFSSILFFQFQL